VTFSPREYDFFKSVNFIKLVPVEILACSSFRGSRGSSRFPGGFGKTKTGFVPDSDGTVSSVAEAAVIAGHPASSPPLKDDPSI
jgi:hypothetical protein